MESLEAVTGILRHRNRSDLASLLAQASIQFDVSDNYGTHAFSSTTTAEIFLPLLKTTSCERSPKAIIMPYWTPSLKFGLLGMAEWR